MNNSFVKRYKNELVFTVVFLALFVGFSFTSKRFFSVSNVMNLFSQVATLELLTLGMTASMLSGGMDLSIGACCSLCTVLCGTFVGTMGMSVGTALLFTLAIAVVCGAFNGIMVGYFKINSMLVTLGTQSLYTGIGLVISKGVTVAIPTDRFGLFGRYMIGGVVPFQIVMMIAAILVAILIYNYLIPGRRIYLIGANPEVARFVGINIAKNITFTYAFCGVCAFLGALVLASRASSGRADVAAPLVLKAVSSAVLGGVSTLGGIGTMIGATLGVAVITIISNGMDMMNLSTYIQQIFTGVLLLIVLAFRHFRRK